MPDEEVLEADRYCDRPQGEFDWEDAVSVFTVADEGEQESLWKQSDTALKVRGVFGKMHRKARAEAMRAFAGEVRRSASTLTKYARTAEFFPEDTIPGEDYAGRHLDAPFSLYRVAANHTTTARDARAALKEALENDWKVADLQKELVKRNKSKLAGYLWRDSEGQLCLDNTPLRDLPDVARFEGLRVRLYIEIASDDDE